MGCQPHQVQSTGVVHSYSVFLRDRCHLALCDEGGLAMCTCTDTVCRLRSSLPCANHKRKRRPVPSRSWVACVRFCRDYWAFAADVGLVRQVTLSSGRSSRLSFDFRSQDAAAVLL